MMQPQRELWCAVIVTTSGALMAPSALALDCSKARTSTEKAICADPELKKLDAQLNRDYAAFRAHYQKSGKYDCLLEDETKKQKEWLRKRDACGADKQCIRSAYENRLQNLNKYTGLCYPQDSSFVHAGRSCYEPTPPTAPVASTSSPEKSTISTPVDSCPPADRYDPTFTATGEGVALNGYFPGGFIPDNEKSKGLPPGYKYYKPVKSWDSISEVTKNKAKKSGVTMDTGYDLAFHTEAEVRRSASNYVHAHGIQGLDIDDLIRRMKPYLNGPRGQKAYEAIKNDQPKFTISEVDVVQGMHADEVKKSLEGRFNKHNQMGMKFQELPTGIQTLLIDFIWEYGAADEIYSRSGLNNPAAATRKAFWEDVYAGNWKDLQAKFEKGKGGFPHVTRAERNLARAKLIEASIDQKGGQFLPEACQQTHIEYYTPYRATTGKQQHKATNGKQRRNGKQSSGGKK